MNKVAHESERHLPLHPESPSLRVDPGGAVRIGKSRVGFDILVEQYESGSSAEDIARDYDTLELADVYAAIAYYLRHKDEVRSYLKDLQAEAESLRQIIESRYPPISREELLARRDARENQSAPTGN